MLSSTRSAFVHVGVPVLLVFSDCGERGDCKEGGFDSQAVDGLLFLRAGGVAPGSLFANARLDYSKAICC